MRQTIEHHIDCNTGTNPQTWTYNNLAFFPIDNQLLGNSGHDAQEQMA